MRDPLTVTVTVEPLFSLPDNERSTDSDSDSGVIVLIARCFVHLFAIHVPFHHLLRLRL